MNNMIRIFENEEFGQIRTLTDENGRTLFCGTDVAKALGYHSPKDAVSAHCKGAVKRRLLTNGGSQNIKFIPEGDVYRLAAHSRLPRAAEFEAWIFDGVLPTIRRTGGYVGNADMFVDNYLSFCEEPLKELFKLQFRCIDQLNERIRHDKPLVEFANQVSNTDNLIDMNEMAKLARAESAPVGRNRLYAVLRGMGILMTDNLPYQKYIDRGYFKVKESVFKTSAMTKTYRQTYVTGKGQLFVIGLLKKYYGKEFLH